MRSSCDRKGACLESRGNELVANLPHHWPTSAKLPSSPVKHPTCAMSRNLDASAWLPCFPASEIGMRLDSAKVKQNTVWVPHRSSGPQNGVGLQHESG